MIDVLNDLRGVAHGHSMLALAEALDDAIHVAAVEIREQPGKLVTPKGHDDKNREFFGSNRSGYGRVSSPDAC